MRFSVRQSFTKFTEPFEGIVLSFYTCVKSLPTFGLGNYVPSAQAAMVHPFKRPDGTLATGAEKAREWHYTKNGACGARSTKADPEGHRRCLWPGRVHPDTGFGCFAHRGWRAAEAALGKLNGFGAPLRVERAYVDSLTERELDRFWNTLRGYLPDIDTWPAPAQLGLLSMAWGLGPHFPKAGLGWPKFTAAAKARQFAVFKKAADGTYELDKDGERIVIGGCAYECVIRNSARNGVNADLFLAAARVDEVGADPDVLFMRPDEVPGERALYQCPAVVKPAPPAPDLSTVLGIQTRLGALGFESGPLDGKMGPRTRAAVIAFQKSRNLVPDGIVGPKTRAALT